MQFLKILFWALLAFVAALFTFGNWKSVSVQLFGNMVAEVNLPFLLLVTFLLGFLPTWIYYNAVRWRLRQRLGAAERTIGDIRDAAEAASPTPSVPPVAPTPVAAPAAPTAPAGRML